MKIKYECEQCYGKGYVLIHYNFGEDFEEVEECCPGCCGNGFILVDREWLSKQEEE